jgi:hypothetical protein
VHDDVRVAIANDNDVEVLCCQIWSCQIWSCQVWSCQIWSLLPLVHACSPSLRSVVSAHFGSLGPTAANLTFVEARDGGFSAGAAGWTTADGGRQLERVTQWRV